MTTGILKEGLVKKAQTYLKAEQEIKRQPLVKEILLIFPNSKLTYKRKE